MAPDWLNENYYNYYYVWNKCWEFNMNIFSYLHITDCYYNSRDTGLLMRKFVLIDFQLNCVFHIIKYLPVFLLNMKYIYLFIFK